MSSIPPCDARRVIERRYARTGAEVPARGRRRRAPRTSGEMSYSANGLSQTGNVPERTLLAGKQGEGQRAKWTIRPPPSPPTGKAMSSISQSGAYDA